jgi:hypothetical protein
MGWLQRIIGKDGTNAATTANGVPVHTGTAAEAGFVTTQFELDAGAITGSRYLKAPYVSEEFRLSVGLDTILANYNFTNTSQNTGKFKHAFTTMLMTQSAGFLNINTALATVSGNYAFLQSWKHFSLQGDGSLHVEIVGQISAMPPANQILETGLFLGTAGIAPADGAFFRLTSAGLQGIVTNAGVETPTGVLVATVPINTNGKYKMIISQREVSFWIDDILGAEILVPAGNAIPYLSVNLPLCFMMRNSGTVTGGCTTKIGAAHISATDIHSSKPWSEQMANQGNSYQGQDGDAAGSLAIYSNAALGAAAALTNTTAAAPNLGLGGVVLVLPTLTAGTDGILFSYQNPVGSVTQPPKTLIVTGVTLDATVQVAFTGGPLALVMGAAYGHTSVSLATTESTTFATGTTKAPRRVPLVTFGFPVTAPVGTGVTRASQKFSSPIVVNPGEFFAITCRNVGTVTSAGALVFTACVDHYFE